MATTKIQGNAAGSGSVTVTAPNTDSNRTVTLPDADVTLPTAHSQATLTTQGDILYASGANTLARLAKGAEGKVLKMGGSNIPEWGSSGVISPSVMTSWATIGTSTTLDITGIAAGAVRLQLFIYEWSMAGDSNFAIRIGDSGGIETSGYISSGWSDGGTSAGATNTDRMGSHSAADRNYLLSWIVDFIHAGSNKWIMWGRGHGSNNGSSMHHSFGMCATKTLSGELDRIQLLNDTFDSGTYRLITWT